jgi:hypothetical protein
MQAIPQTSQADQLPDQPHLTAHDIELCQVVIFAFEMLLQPRPSEHSTLRFDALSEFLHSHSHFAAKFDMSSVIYSLNWEHGSAFEQLLKKFDALALQVQAS